MKIIILGAGQIGSALARYLVTEHDNDVTIIDENGEQLQALQERFDLRVIQGKVTYPQVLENAGAENADILVAVTSSDEENMLACQISQTFFNIPKKIARVRAVEYSDERYSLFSENNALAIDHIISPEKLITQYICQLIKYPGVLQIASFYDNKIYLAAVTAYYGGALVGCEISELSEHLPHIDVKIVAIYRKNKFIRPIASTIIEAADIVYFITESENIKAITNELQRLEKPYKRVMISGGGNVAIELAKRLEQDYQVRLIEQNAKKAEIIAEQLANTIVLHGEASDQELLYQEQVETTDLFIAVTNDDESNIMSSMLAKRMGAKKVIVLIQRQAYLELINESVIDIAISPQLSTISALLSHVRKEGILKVVSLRQGTSEVIEIKVTGDAENSSFIGLKTNEVKLPNSATIGAIIRKNEVIITQNDEMINQDDHLIIFLSDSKAINEIEKLL